MIVLVTGGQGFIGHNLVLKLSSLQSVERIIVVDNYITSTKKSVPCEKVTLLEFDINTNAFVDFIKHTYPVVHEIYHLASLASPVAYKKHLIETLDVGYIGTRNVLDLCVHYKAKMLYTSTSEVYGDALEHPQKESYYGNVNPYGERSNYDESKRIGETLIYNYQKLYNCDTRIVRIFNTYGPYMNLHDGRIVTEIIKALMTNGTLTIFGDGSQTRSLCFVDDTVNMIVDAMDSDYHSPINVGCDHEISVNDLVDVCVNEYVRTCDTKLCTLPIVYTQIDKDDPKVRRPCLSLNTRVLGKREYTPLSVGIEKTIQYFTTTLY